MCRRLSQKLFREELKMRRPGCMERGAGLTTKHAKLKPVKETGSTPGQKNSLESKRGAQSSSNINQNPVTDGYQR